MYSLEAIKEAFWATFHKSGEQWFDYLGDEEECQACTEENWEDFLEELTGEEGSLTPMLTRGLGIALF